MNLKLINQELDQFIKDRDWDQFHSVKNLSMALSVEAAELVELFQWMKEEDSNRVKDHPELKSRLEDELADVFTYLLRIVSKADINLEEVVLNKIKKNALKYPVATSRGSSKKYDEL